jgi:SSS family solute:Na+ symporter
MRRRIFSTNKRSSSFLIIGALIPSSGLFVVNCLFASSGNNSELIVLYFQSVLAVVFGAVFFAPAWGRMPLKTEGELIPYRFIGKGAVSLSKFRGIYLGLLILPLAKAVSIQPLSEYLFSDSSSQHNFTLFTLAILVLNIFFNTLYNRIRIDALIGYSTFLVAIFYLVIQLASGSSFSHHSENHIASWANDLNLKTILFSIGLLWWFATIVDLPDMRGQLLLTLKNGSQSRRNVIFSFVISYFIQGILLTFPLIYHSTNDWSWLNSMFIVFIVFIIFNAFQAMFSANHWAASLIYAGVIRPLLSNDNHEKTIGMGTMLVGLVITSLWLVAGKTTAELFATIFLFTAGVGPVFIIRWFWSKVNAQTVLSAMIGAPIIWILWLLLKQIGVSTFLVQNLEISETFIDILIPGILNSIVWLTTLALTQNKEEELHAKQWIQEVGILNEFKSGKNWLLFIGLSLLSGLILFGPSFILK